MTQQVAIAVTDMSQVGEARRAAARMSRVAEHDDTVAGRLAIIVTEVATNLVRYARQGRIVLSANAQSHGGTCEVLAIDSGPGMDPVRCLVDGYSTGGTPGNGLGAVQRLASEFDIYSGATGTVLMARVRPADAPAPAGAIRWGCVNLPAQDERECGDSFRVTSGRSPRASMMIADGLGHGPDAAAASMLAGTTFDSNPGAELPAFMQASHAAMSGTRGAAVAIAALDRRAQVLKYAGVGNIVGTLIGAAGRRGLPSQNGIVGSIFPRIQTYQYPLPASGILVMHSDGLQSRWSLEGYPGLTQRHPALIAGVLLRDFYRGRDDVTVLVGAWQGGLS